VWWQRREIVKRETVAGPSQTTFAIHAITTNFVQSAKGNSVSKEVVWSKPDRGEYKLNIDASFHSNGTCSVGTVLRNDRGEALAGFAAMAEASALQKGLKFMEQLGIQSVVIKSNSLELIQACNAEVELWSPSAPILAHYFMKAQPFDSIHYRYCSLDANHVAHELARNSFSTNSVLRWSDAPQNVIIPFLLNDATLLNL
jgi:ribonuclease HI